MKHNFKSNDEFASFLLKQLEKLKKQLLLEGVKTIDEQQVTDFIIDNCDLIFDPVFVDDKKIKQVYLFDYDDDLYYSLSVNLNTIITLIISKIKIRVNKKTIIGTVIDNLINISLIDKNRTPLARIAPDHIVKFNNGYLNTKTDEFFTDMPDYHFVKKSKYNYLTESEVNPISLALVNKVFDEWTDGENDFKNYLFQVCRAAIEGNGRYKCHVFISPGGGGKSSFFRLLKLLTGDDVTLHVNIDEYDDDNLINGISKNKKLIIGDDLSTHAKMSGKKLSRFKSIIEGEPITVNVKFEPARIIQTNAVFVQGTNTELKFFENSPAVADRIIFGPWTSKNFRTNKIKDYNLAKLLGKEGKLPDINFIEACIYKIFKDTTYFEQFDIPNRFKNRVNDMLNNADSVYLFYQHIKVLGLLDFKILPSNVLYNHYKLFLKEENPAAKPLQLNKFIPKLYQYLSDELLNGPSNIFTIPKQNDITVKSLMSRLNKQYDKFSLHVYCNQAGLDYLKFNIPDATRTSYFINDNKTLWSKTELNESFEAAKNIINENDREKIDNYFDKISNSVEEQLKLNYLYRNHKNSNLLLDLLHDLNII